MGEAQFGGTGDEHHVVPPCADGDFDASHLADSTRPGARRVDDDGGGENALRRVHARHFSSADADARHGAILHEDGAAPTGGVHQRGRGRDGVGVARFGFVSGEVEVVRDEGGGEAFHVVGGDQHGGDAEALEHGGVGFERVHMFALDELEEARAREAAGIGADAFVPIAEPLEGFPGETRFGFEVVVHADEPAGASRRARGEVTSLDDRDFDAAHGEMVGEAGAVHAAAEDEEVGGGGHGGW